MTWRTSPIGRAHWLEADDVGPVSRCGRWRPEASPPSAEYSFGTPSVWDYRIDLPRPVGPYRTDLVIAREGVSIHVETDGHEFHEKTKEQARHDKERDRFYVAQGLLVLRFTGSEVFGDAPRCVREVLDLLNAKTKNGTELL